MRLCKKSTESFREYAQRWRDLAASVVPPMPESEMVQAFIQAQQPPFYEKVMSLAGRSFVEIAKQGELVEDGIRSGKFIDIVALKATTDRVAVSQSYTKKSDGKKKEGERSLILPTPAQPAAETPQATPHTLYQATPPANTQTTDEAQAKRW